MDEVERRREAVRRHRAGETAQQVAAGLGRTDRWVRKWTARADAAQGGQDWAQSHSRAPRSSPTRTSDQLRQQVLEARKSAVMALHEVNLATCYCSHVLLLYGDGEWDAGPTRELLTAENLSRLYRCRVRLIDDGRQRVFAVAGGFDRRNDNM